MQATYKLISISDIESVVLMMRDFYAMNRYPMDHEQSKKLLAEFIADEKLGKIWLIGTPNEIVGYAILTFVFSFEYGGRIAFLDELYIKDACRGKGMGKQAIQFIQTEAKALDLKLIYLEVESDNVEAERLYLSTHFEMHNRKLMKFKPKNKN